MSIDELLIDIKDRGWHIVNMFQLYDGTWRVNLHSTDGKLCGNFGISMDPLEALQMALDNAESEAYPVKEQVVVVAPQETVPEEKQLNLLDLIRSRRKIEKPFVRRV